MDNPLDNLYKESLGSNNYTPSEAQWAVAKKGIAASFKSALYVKLFTVMAVLSGLTVSSILIIDQVNSKSEMAQIPSPNLEPENNVSEQKAIVLQLPEKPSQQKISPVKNETFSQPKQKPSKPILTRNKPANQKPSRPRIYASIPKSREVEKFISTPVKKQTALTELGSTAKSESLPDLGIVRSPFQSKWEFSFGFDALKNFNNQNVSEGREYAKSAWSSQSGLALKYNLNENWRVGLAANYSQWAEKYCYAKDRHFKSFEKTTETYRDTVGSINTMVWDGHEWVPIGKVLRIEYRQRTVYTPVTKTITESGEHRNVYHLLQLPISLSYKWEWKDWIVEPGMSYNFGITAATDGKRMDQGILTDLSNMKINTIQNGFSPSLEIGRRLASNAGINARLGYQKQTTDLLKDSNGAMSLNQWSAGARLWFAF